MISTRSATISKLRDSRSIFITLSSFVINLTSHLSFKSFWQILINFDAGILSMSFLTQIFFVSLTILSFSWSNYKIYVSTQSEYTIYWFFISNACKQKSPFFMTFRRCFLVLSEWISRLTLSPFFMTIYSLSPILATLSKGNGGMCLTFSWTFYCCEFLPNWSLNLPS